MAGGVGHTGGLTNPRPWRGRCRAGYSNTGGPPLPRKRAPLQKKKKKKKTLLFYFREFSRGAFFQIQSSEPASCMLTALWQLKEATLKCESFANILSQMYVSNDPKTLISRSNFYSRHCLVAISKQRV